MIPVLDPEARRHFRQRLRREFAERCSRNPRYSLRAFARWLRVDHATVAALIRGTRTLTPAMLTRLAVRLGLGAQEVEQYRLGRAAEAPQGPLEDGILDLVGHPDFRADTRWMGRILGVGTDEVSAALPDLLRTNRLVMDTRRRWAVRTPAKAQPPTRS